jgi:hypothetical protein
MSPSSWWLGIITNEAIGPAIRHKVFGVWVGLELALHHPLP